MSDRFCRLAVLSQGPLKLLPPGEFMQTVRLSAAIRKAHLTAAAALTDTTDRFKLVEGPRLGGVQRESEWNQWTCIAVIPPTH